MNIHRYVREVLKNEMFKDFTNFELKTYHEEPKNTTYDEQKCQ